MSKDNKNDKDEKTKREKKIIKAELEKELMARIAAEMFKQWKEKQKDNGMYFD